MGDVEVPPPVVGEVEGTPSEVAPDPTLDGGVVEGPPDDAAHPGPGRDVARVRVTGDAAADVYGERVRPPEDYVDPVVEPAHASTGGADAPAPAADAVVDPDTRDEAAYVAESPEEGGPVVVVGINEGGDVPPGDPETDPPERSAPLAL